MITKTFVGDFETTVFDGQTYTEVWASASVELYTENVKVFHSIDEQFEYFIDLDCNIVCYYHNLKFDGSFWLAYLLEKLNYKQAVTNDDTGNIYDIRFVDKYKMKNNTFSYVISHMGQWYKILIKTHGKYIELRDSFKLLPFSLKRIGESFGTKHKKLEMKYEGFRYAGCEITSEEEEYIKNDVLVIKEALEICFNQGHDKLTIGSCCLAEYKKSLPDEYYKFYFPDLTEIALDEEVYGNKNADEWIRKSYKGGWCYVVKGKQGKEVKNGCTLDVNSLYPSMMSSESGNKYPIGKPTFWNGNFIPTHIQAYPERFYYFIRIKTQFRIKHNKLPFIQIKSSLLYKSTEMLETSDVYDKQTDSYYSEYKDLDGKIHDTRLVLTLTETDYKLFNEHYDAYNFEILGGCYFQAKIGIFDEYINKYKRIKLNSTGAKRELAKLFLNNLYGKMASNTNSSFKVAHLNEDNTISFYTVIANDKKAGYIAVGSAITSYARNFTIRAAQANYYGADKTGFIYADTDSIHCDLSPEDVKGVTIHDKNFCCWKLETQWNRAIFVRQKTYIEVITHYGNNKIDEVEYNVKCAGMPDTCKNIFIMSLTQQYDLSKIKNKNILEFIKVRRYITDFKIGLCIYGKLIPKRIQGGTILVPTTFEMR